MTMQATETSNRATSRGAAAGSDLTLDSLAQRSFATLEALYKTAKNAKSIRAVEGMPKGRMLAVRMVDETRLGAFVRAFAGSPHFIWDGKTFTSSSDEEGSGINRVQIPGALGKQNLFPFKTHFGPSAIDAAPALILDYDLPENPPWIRRIHDEVREVSPGLFFGPAMWKGAKVRSTVLWFALDARGRGAR
jgi:hypothetical protein